MPQCTAKSKRTGNQCRRYAIPGKTKCKHHGGRSTGPKNPNTKNNAIKADGIYSQYLKADDLRNYAAAGDTIGSIDIELQLVKMQLAKVVKAQSEMPPDDMQLEEIAHGITDPGADNEAPTGQGQTKIKKTTKRRNFDALIDRFTGRIESLEKTRKELMSKGDDSVDSTKLIILGGMPVAAQQSDDNAGVTISVPAGM